MAEPIIESTLSLAGGINTRVHRTLIGQNQAVELLNADLNQPGFTAKRKGITRFGSDMGDYAILAGARYKKEGGVDMMIAITAEPALLKSTGGDWTKVSFDGTPSAATKGKIVIANNLAYLFTDTNPVQTYDQSSCTDLTSLVTTPPEDTTVALWHKNRLLVGASAVPSPGSGQGSGLFYSNSIAPSTFNHSTQVHKIDYAASNVLKALLMAGMNRVFAVYDWGVHVIDTSSNIAYWSAAPYSNRGTIAENAAIMLGSVPCVLDQDGFWRLDRPAPLTHLLKDGWWDRINWNYAHNAAAHLWDNRIFLALPVDGSTINNAIFVYHILNDPNAYGEGWSVWKSDNLNISCFWEMDFDGEKHLYAGCADDHSRVYVMEDDYDDDGTTYEFQIITRGYTLGAPDRNKAGYRLEVRGESTDDYTPVRVYRNPDTKGFTETFLDDETQERLDLQPDHPVLPQTLDFNLAIDKIMVGKYPLNQLEQWEDMQMKISDGLAAQTCKIMHQRVSGQPLEYKGRNI